MTYKQLSISLVHRLAGPSFPEHVLTSFKEVFKVSRLFKPVIIFSFRRLHLLNPGFSYKLIALNHSWWIRIMTPVKRGASFMWDQQRCCPHGLSKGGRRQPGFLFFINYMQLTDNSKEGGRQEKVRVPIAMPSSPKLSLSYLLQNCHGRYKAESWDVLWEAGILPGYKATSSRKSQAANSMQMGKSIQKHKFLLAS